MRSPGQAIFAALAIVLALDCAANAECYVEAPLRPVHRTYIQRDVVEPGVYEVARSPSLYGWVRQPVEESGLVRPRRRWAARAPSSIGYVHRRILLRPYKNYAHFQRPYIAFSVEHLTIQPEGSRLVPLAKKPDC
ncbi:MAG TPA: hypothetical protein VE986_07865 [Hyphomicrobiales bacterium]|nr:hypothetical protein [Hyphomicrobiales bacterium]